MPKNIQPLKRSGGDFLSTPHPTELCQRCMELGYNCRQYTPPIVSSWTGSGSGVDFPDDQSIISESSTISSSWAEEQQLSDGDLTPVASDEEETDRFLESKMKLMTLNNNRRKL